MRTVGKPAQIVVPATLEALRQVSAEIEAYLAAIDGIVDAQSLVYNIVLAVQELCVNIVTHGYMGEPGTIRVELALAEQPRRLVVSVFDRAPRIFDEASWRAPNLDEPQEHGLGIWLIRELMDEVSYTPAPGDNRWRLVKNLPA